jgi:DNA-binding protein H-NS
MSEQMEYPTAVEPFSAPDMTHADNPTDDPSVEELRQQQAELEQKIRKKREAEKKAVIEQIVNVVHTYDIPIDELVDALGGLKIKRKGVKATQKYLDPVTGVTWSGRGKEPSWIRGKDRKKFLIPDTD